MKTNIFLTITLTVIFVSNLFSQSFNVDMAPAIAGVQPILKSDVFEQTITVEFIGTGLSSVSGYQLKIAFDSTKFEFISGAPDYGITGAKNILKKNNGTITGIFKTQTYPACDSILDIAYVIIGTRDLSVTGTGLIGVAQFKSKIKSNDSGFIKILEGSTVSYNEQKTTVITFTNGKYIVSKSIKIITERPFSAAHSLKRINGKISFYLSAGNVLYLEADPGKNLKVSIISLNGKTVFSWKFSPFERETVEIPLCGLGKGTYLVKSESEGIPKVDFINILR